MLLILDTIKQIETTIPTPKLNNLWSIPTLSVESSLSVDLGTVATISTNAISTIRINSWKNKNK